MSLANLTWSRSLEIAIGALLVSLVAAEVLVYSPNVLRSQQELAVKITNVSSTSVNATLTIDITHGRSDQSVRLVAFPVSTLSSQRRAVMIYDDLGYPSAGVGPTAVQGMFDQLTGELKSRQYAQPVSGLNAVALRDVLKETPLASSRTVVMMTGVLPVTVYSRDLDLVSPWVRAGGLLVWGGGAIGFWSGVGGRPLTSSNAVGESGTKKLLGVGVLQYPTGFGQVGDTATEMASALDIQYRFTGAGIMRASIFARGGTTLGWYSGKFSSLSYLPSGTGGYLIFGGEIPDEAAASRDLARVLMADAIDATGRAVAMDVQLSSLPSRSVITWQLPFAVPPSGVRVVAFDPNPDAIYFSTQAARSSLS